MLDLRQIRSFAAVAHERSVTRAASTLNYAQSSVTAQLHALESELGVPLFDRVGRGLSLTAAGTDFLPYAERLINLAEEARLSVHRGGTPAGRLTLTASESVLTYRMPDLLRNFQCQFPAVEIVLQASPICASAIVSDPTIDLAITIDEPVQNSQYVVHSLHEERMVFAVWAGHPLARTKRVTADAIAAEQLLLTERRCSYRALFERTLARTGARLTRSLEFTSVEAIKQCALARMGIAVLPEIVVAEELRSGSLVALCWPPRRLYVYTQIVRNKEKWFSPTMQAFWTTAVDVLSGKAQTGRPRQ
ncbi:DNA-binding transcriptional regulator, LysR family [Granulicella pectinivorans]|uniref:DNA-binding transcriptional regulator, LysR family n=1 Tax=Granulicella pectinivorans TaxID=474950 RepID=A0A1I6MPW5_9BACT|nr:LysR family transcriptional regulator [Granulicella pectinivorans]SFS17750.1 DNA-binding transcriptional regulator, LysR family [Granulicella pectinivorans]